MKYFLIAGEKSGDLHASKLMNAIKKIDSKAQFEFFGGDLMIKESNVCHLHIRAMAFMGFWDVIKNFNKIFRFLYLCKVKIKIFKPDVVIGVDYTYFNLKIAKWCFRKGFKYQHYLAPKTWAFNERRIKRIKKYVKQLYCIFPFEKAYFQSKKINATYVGNPVLESVIDFKKNVNFRSQNQLSEDPIIALFPGSRTQEIKEMLSYMILLALNNRKFQFVIGAVSSVPKELYKEVENQSLVKIVYDQSYDLMSNARYAITKSGTITLEAAMFDLPQLSMYLTNGINRFVLKKIILKRIKFITPVNLIANRKVIDELILSTKEVNKELLQKSFDSLILNGDILKKEYKKLKEKISGIKTSEFLAREIFDDSNF